MRAELEARVRFEALLAEIAARFVSLSADEVIGEIEEAQRRLCEHLGFDRSSLFQFAGANQRSPFLLRHLHQPKEAAVPGPAMDGRSWFPWIVGQLQHGEPVLISRLDDLPVEAQHATSRLCGSMGPSPWQCFRYRREKDWWLPH